MYIVPHHASGKEAFIILECASFSMGECVHVAEYLNLHNLWLLNLPARKIKCLSCLFYTNSLEVTTWLMKGPRL